MAGTAKTGKRRVTAPRTLDAKHSPESSELPMAPKARCPKKHVLPHTTAHGQCTPLYCSASSADFAQHQVEPEDVALIDVGVEPLGTNVENEELRGSWGKGNVEPQPQDALSKEAEHETREMNAAAMRLRFRHRVMKSPAPGSLQGSEAEDYAATKLVELAPMAVAEVEYQLLMGDDESRWRAAKQVLESTGYGKKETGGAAHQTIIIMGDSKAPWQKDVHAQVVDAKRVIAGDSKKEGSNGAED